MSASTKLATSNTQSSFLRRQYGHFVKYLQGIIVDISYTSVGWQGTQLVDRPVTKCSGLHLACKAFNKSIKTKPSTEVAERTKGPKHLCPNPLSTPEAMKGKAAPNTRRTPGIPAP